MLVKGASMREDGFEIITEASTTGNINSRKESHIEQIGEEFNDEDEEEDEDDAVSTGK